MAWKTKTVSQSMAPIWGQYPLNKMKSQLSAII